MDGPASSSAGAISVGLGLDAGGTQTRWALADAAGGVLREGAVAGLSALQLGSDAGRLHIRATLQALAEQMGDATPPRAVFAGVTGFDATQQPQLAALLAEALQMPAAAVQTLSDIELACRAAFAPGAGLVLYAGTGAVAACIDAQGTLHRAGGRGVLIDDAGGGHWIACRALREVWRAEDERPGAWRDSRLAAALFERIGGSDWHHTRQWVYGASRGEVGTLALAVAHAATAGDAAALQILHDAGSELARLALVLRQRIGVLPVALAGRVFDLHPIIETTLRAALPAATPVQRLTIAPHHAAARLAASPHRRNPA